MIQLHNSLPFSDSLFYWFILISVIGIYLIKLAINTPKTYKIGISIITFIYLFLLFPKPFHILSFILFGFLTFKYIGQKFKIKGFKSILIYIIPLFLMKFLNVIPDSFEEFNLAKYIFQIAGLSYATFKMVQVHIDESETENVDFLTYFTFIGFPPTLLIGPIDRYNRFSQNFNLGFLNINYDNLTKGLNYILRGLVYKYIFAYAIMRLIIEHLDHFSGISYHFYYMYSYIFYLFFDFSGYSLLAMGSGYLLGIEVPFNFNKPFIAQNPKDFWYRWHKTLGDWLNDYFFKPIFKELTSKKILTPIKRQSIALLLTFTLMGFWNGFEIHFILSGFLFGIYSMTHNYYVYQCRKHGKDVIFGNLKAKYVKFISILILFHFVAFSIYIFSGKLI
jgi:membrane protein involved in D-alanine export